MRSRATVAVVIALAFSGALLALSAPATAQGCSYDFEEERVVCDQPENGSGSDGGDDDEPWWAQPSVEVGLGVVGLTASGVGGGYAILKNRRRRRNLRGILDEIEQVYGDHKTQPDEGLPKLAKLRSKTRAFHDKGKLSDGQFLELDNRIGERLARLRLLKIDRDLPDLPDALDRELEHLIGDGTVSRNDVDHVRERAEDLDVDPGTVDRVVDLLDAWAETDGSPSDA